MYRFELSDRRPTLALIMVSYVLINIAFSQWLKRMLLLDVFAIVGGFVLRAVAGAVVIAVSTNAVVHWSPW